jgi:hypothetical protein
MTTLNDAILTTTGGPTVNDGLAAWYGKLATETLQDAERRWLIDNSGFSTGTNNDLWMQGLTALGYTGSLNDMLVRFWEDGGGFSFGVSGLSIENAAPAVIVVKFNGDVFSPLNDYLTGFSVDINSTPATISTGVRQADNSVVHLTLSARVKFSDTITVSYSSTTGDLESVADATALESFTDRPVVNNVLGTGVAPTPVSAVVENANPDLMLVEFGAPISSPTSDYLTGFSADINAGPLTLTGATLSSDNVTLALDLGTTVVGGDTLDVSYTAVSGDLESRDATPIAVADFADFSVTNNVTGGGTSPEVQAVLDRMTAITAGETTAITAFVDGCVADGNWTLIDEFFCFALNGTDWLTGWRTHTASVVGGTIVRTANGAELAGAGSNLEYIETNIDLATLTNFQQQDASSGLFIHACPDWGAGNFDFYGIDNNTAGSWKNRHRGSDTNDLRIYPNTGTLTTVSNSLPPADLVGFLWAQAAEGTTAQCYRDGVTFGTTGTAGDKALGTIANGTVSIFGTKDPAVPDLQQPSRAATFTSFYIGSASINHAQMNTRIRALQTALGVT